MSDRVYFMKPQEVEALQYTGDNIKEVKEFTKNGLSIGIDTISLHGVYLSIGTIIVKNGYDYMAVRPDFFNKEYFYLEQPGAMHLPAIRREPNFKTYEELM